mgnify:CR=1 FL=1
MILELYIYFLKMLGVKFFFAVSTKKATNPALNQNLLQLAKLSY